MYFTSLRHHIFQINTQGGDKVIKVIELFSGIGAQAQGLKEANIEHEVIAISDIDKYANKVYKALHGDVYNFGDIREIKKLPKADLWTYSFPCTDISIAGRLEGLGEETRSGLLWQVKRLLEISKENDELPKFLLLENVKNLVSKRFIAEFNKWLSFLESLGYKNYWKIMNAKDYGIPQNRERVFCISIRGEHSPFLFPEKQELKVTLKDLLEKEVDESYFLSDKMLNYLLAETKTKYDRKARFIGNLIRKNQDVAVTVTTNAGSRAVDNFIPTDENGEDLLPIKNATKLGFLLARDGDGVDISGRIQYHRGTVQQGITQTIKTSPDVGVVVACAQRKRDDGKQHIEVSNREYANAITTVQKDSMILDDTYKNRSVREYENYSPTIRAGRSGLKVKEKLRIRKLTPRECMRLMGWSDENIDKMINSGVSKTQLYKMAGNSIVVNCLTEIFKKIKGVKDYV